MKISPDNHHSYTNNNSKKHTVENENFSSTLATAITTAKKTHTETKRTDFTTMSSMEMFNWMNSQIENGEISLEESFSFLAMTIRIPVDGHISELSHEKINFIEKISNGMVEARSKNNEKTLETLERTMAIMQRFQGSATQIETRA